MISQHHSSYILSLIKSLKINTVHTNTSFSLPKSGHNKNHPQRIFLFFDEFGQAPNITMITMINADRIIHFPYGSPEVSICFVIGGVHFSGDGV